MESSGERENRGLSQDESERSNPPDASGASLGSDCMNNVRGRGGSALGGRQISRLEKSAPLRIVKFSRTVAF